MKKLFLFFSLNFFILLSRAFCQQIPADKKIEDIIHKMTIAEKIDFIGGYMDFYIRAYPQYGIPQIKMSDGPVGVRNYGPATSFPASICLTASWDTSLASDVGRAIGQEARAKGVNIMLGPAMNIHRAPMDGRNFEYLGEDPYLAGKIASQYIRGMQSEGVMATAKHFMGNNQEFDRNQVSSDIDERTMREIYLPAFQASVTEGHVASVMNSYNLVNGIHTSQHDYLLNKILKEDWKFDGFVMSDWGSTYSAVGAANAGLDLEMPSGRFMCKDSLLPAIKDGRVSERTIDDKVRRILGQYERFNLFEKPDISEGFKMDTVQVRKTALDDARGGIVLLKNEGNILPLDFSKIKTIAVVGPNAHPAVFGGGGSAFVVPEHPISFLDALKKLVGDKVKITYEPGSFNKQTFPEKFFTETNFYTYVDGKKVPGLKLSYHIGRGHRNISDSVKIVPSINIQFDESSPETSKGYLSLNYSGFLKVDTSGIYRFVISSSAMFSLSIDGKRVYSKHSIGSWPIPKESISSVELPLEAGKEYQISFDHWQWLAIGAVRLGYETPAVHTQTDAAIIDKMQKVVAENDLTILCIGFNNEIETEGADRTFQLPDDQEKLISGIIKTKKDFVVVLNAGGNVDMRNWLAQTKGLVYAWYPGGDGNIAVAEILAGITNPSGKLPVSFEKRWEDNATYHSYFDDDGDKHVKYSEGIFLGYRHFDKNNIEPQFPFGFGLSYTTFEYSNLKVNKNKFTPDEGVEVSLIVKNSGKVDGAEIVQLYVNQEVSALPRPPKELKAFSKVWLKAGESKEVKFKLKEDAFHYFNPDKMQWVVEPGNFNILVGASSRDIRLKEKVIVVKSNDVLFRQ